MAEFVIDRILIYPVRSLGGMSIIDAEISPGGSLLGDREWVVVRPDGSVLWQGDIPRTTLLSAFLSNGELSVRGHDGGIGPRPRDAQGGATTVRQDGYSLSGVDQGEEIAQWLSDQLRTSCRLVRIGAEAHRWGGLNPIHAVSLVSLAALNERLAEQGAAPVEVERFRPNVVLSGRHSAFDEERAEEIHFPDASLVLREPCVRCELPNISRLDASRGKQPLKMIGTMSRTRSSARPASFGVYCTAEGKSLRTGMEDMTGHVGQSRL
ncbi:MAG: MOSC domain-containing protein [Devosia sp.]|jgi:uncharacterized protein YcbX|uniref:MOSC domain-containing protein n=1 Tax=unclassified Devosia TaxID=196773 RepID=UPI001A05907A|nr:MULTISPECIES: MOSC N-terminal beta barrel domain-containing protein [unclassified Devosia]MBF0678252.1 MOSC domain-containing protein [Devosia sp.]WEJ31509.1 MOSC domain-containing protein [Devosia sp. SD17-2]